jgi:hypothetical protein
MERVAGGFDALGPGIGAPHLLQTNRVFESFLHFGHVTGMAIPLRPGRASSTIPAESATPQVPEPDDTGRRAPLYLLRTGVVSLSVDW